MKGQKRKGKHTLRSFDFYIICVYMCYQFKNFFKQALHQFRASQVALVVKNSSTNTEDITDAGSIPGSGRSPAVRNCNMLQCSYLENAMNRGATVYGVAKN